MADPQVHMAIAPFVIALAANLLPKLLGGGKESNSTLPQPQTPTIDSHNSLDQMALLEQLRRKRKKRLETTPADYTTFTDLTY